MALKFYNIRSREIIVCDSEEKIAAFVNSSDRGLNAMNGQDFGWRLAPEVVVKLKRLKTNEEQLEKIARKIKKEVEELTETDLLTYISSLTPVDEAPVAEDGDFEEEYLESVREYERRLNEQIKKSEKDLKKEDAKNAGSAAE